MHVRFRQLALILAIGLGMPWPAEASYADSAAEIPSQWPIGHMDAAGPVSQPVAPESWLHAGRDRLHRGALWLVEGVDRWFGDRPFAESGGGVSGSVYLSGLQRQEEGFSADLRFHLDVSMPNIDDRIVFFVGRDDPREVVAEQRERFAEEQRITGQTVPDSSTYFAGLGYLLRDNVQLRLGIRGGYKVYGQARLQGDWQLSPQQRVLLTETLFVAVEDGLGATTAFTHLRALGADSVLRSRTSGTVSTEIDGMDWSAALGWFWGGGNRREWALDGLAQGNTSVPVKVREYGVRSVVRAPVYEDWLVAELTVGRMFVRQDHDYKRRGQWLAGVGIEVFF